MIAGLVFGQNRTSLSSLCLESTWILCALLNNFRKKMASIGLHENLGISEPWSVIRRVLGMGNSQPKRIIARKAPGSAMCMESSSKVCFFKNFHIPQEQVQSCEPLIGIFTIFVFSEPFILVGPSTRTKCPAFSAACTSSSQYTPAPPRMGGYSIVNKLIGRPVVIKTSFPKFCFSAKINLRNFMQSMKKGIALVTGGSKGIGRALCLRLAQAGYQVFSASRSSKLDSEMNGITQLSVDLSDGTATQSFAREFIEQYGIPDILVNNAGYGAFFEWGEFPEEEINRQIQVLFSSPIQLCRVFAPAMSKKGRGLILNLSSLATPLSIALHAPL